MSNTEKYPENWDFYNDRPASATPKPRAGEHVPRFPIGGSKDAVFSFLRQRGFVMSEWSDKHWGRADGIALHVYGTGSKARIYDKDGLLMVDDALDSAVFALEDATRKAIPKSSGR